MRVAIGAGLVLLLAGCGGGATITTNTGADRSADRTSEPPSDARMSDASTASGGSNDCSKNPDFAPIYAGAKVSVCSSTHFGNTGKDAGSVSYTADAAPAAVLAFAKESAAKSGLTVRIANDTMLSASEGSKRGFAMFASPDGAGTKVTVNWNNTP
jgi:hypothetical protein